MEKYSNLRETFNLCNDIFGRVFFNHSIATLLYYVNTPAVLTRMEISVDKLYKLVYFGYHCVTYVSACEIHKRVGIFIFIN